ncbi:ATP-binding protein [Aquiflexum sp.]|uniref:ATP-binding protein n=1 Tax=Aquiflexum sp. TaxID=1872584 RepID=UPI00359452DE
MKSIRKNFCRIWKIGILTPAVLLFGEIACGQNLPPKSSDERTIDSLYLLGRNYFFNDLDSAVFYIEKSFHLSKEINFTYGIARATQSFGEIKRIRGDLVGSVEDQLEALRIFKEIGDRDGECMGYAVLGFTYAEGRDGATALRFLKEAKEIYVKDLSDLDSLPLTVPSFLFSNLGFAYFILGELDSAQKYQDLAFTLINNTQEPKPVKNIIFRRLSNIEFEKGNYGTSINYLKMAIENNILVGNTNHWDMPISYAGIARSYLKMEYLDSALHYSYRALSGSKKVDRNLGFLEATELLAEIYKREGNKDSAYHYLEVSSGLKDELFGVEKLNKLTLLLTEQLEQQQQSQQQESERRLSLEKARFRLWILVAVLSVMVLSILLFFFNRTRKAALKSKSKIEKAYDQLKSTQAQLIQSEKMASLGQLTAGIAHEIQNPLNFVNNFSEVSAELVEEIEEERAKSRETRDETLVSEILGDIKQNLKKINHHGKRADAIVKGMLEHSRTGSGEKELTDINSLASEYLNLAYQSYKSKNEGVDIKLITDLDQSLPKIELVRADIGKVLLNILNNAFYAVTSKFDIHHSSFEIQELPKVTIKTKNLGNTPDSYRVQISISDNGPGIPDAIKDKIFQPFFTTKPTGQGTGLGLSLSYDIVKAHGGELKVETEEGDGSEFIIQLPIT